MMSTGSYPSSSFCGPCALWGSRPITSFPSASRKATASRMSTSGSSRNGRRGLVISVDCGIKAISFARAARAKGIDVIITDHHRPGEDLPQAEAILNPVLGRFRLSLPRAGRRRRRLQIAPGPPDQGGKGGRRCRTTPSSWPSGRSPTSPSFAAKTGCSSGKGSARPGERRQPRASRVSSSECGLGRQEDHRGRRRVPDRAAASTPPAAWAPPTRP